MASDRFSPSPPPFSPRKRSSIREPEKQKQKNNCKGASSPDQNLPPASGRHMRVFVTGSPVHLEANQLRKRIRKQVRQTKRSKVFKHRSMTVGIKQLFGNSEKLSYSEFPSTSRASREPRTEKAKHSRGEEWREYWEIRYQEKTAQPTLPSEVPWLRMMLASRSEPLRVWNATSDV